MIPVIERYRRIEFGDFQTPENLALIICERLRALGIQPKTIIEPTCGVGAFVLAAAKTFLNTNSILGFETNQTYLEILQTRLEELPNPERIQLEQADFFATDWSVKLQGISEDVLVLGNFPWVTNAAIGLLGGTNLPNKSNFLKHSGFDALTGKANFDISEFMLLEVLRWFKGRSGNICMLVKKAVARKILAHAERQSEALSYACMIGIDTKKYFGASVESCLLVMRFSRNTLKSNHDYTIFKDLDDSQGLHVGHRNGLTISDLTAFEQTKYLFGKSPQKWRSGIKHDAAAIMEFTQTESGMKNGLGEITDLESTYLYPLLKGSDVGSVKPWRGKYVLVTQQFVGESTSPIQTIAPKTWAYLEKHAKTLDNRGSSIYAKNPRFSIFGVGNYAFQPWRIAICSLYKRLCFRLVAPQNDRPVMFDDTVYYISFQNEADAVETLRLLELPQAKRFLSALIFWDDKRPIKTSLLNVLNWLNLEDKDLTGQQDLFLTATATVHHPQKHA